MHKTLHPLWPSPLVAVRLVASAASPPSVFNHLLEWANEGVTQSASSYPEGESVPLQLPVHVANAGGTAGRGLFATRAVAPGETLLSVPFDRLFKSDEASDGMHWAAGMALRLLKVKGACHASGSAALPLAGSQDHSSQWGPWISALPSSEELKTPLAYREDELAGLGDPGAINEVLGMQACIRACYEVASEELSEDNTASSSSTRLLRWDDFLWAVQIFTSRCFFEPSLGCHLAVPGIDMANHRWEISPDEGHFHPSWKING